MIPTKVNAFDNLLNLLHPLQSSFILDPAAHRFFHTFAEVLRHFKPGQDFDDLLVEIVLSNAQLTAIVVAPFFTQAAIVACRTTFVPHGSHLAVIVVL
jgi:hypothetical protein